MKVKFGLKLWSSNVEWIAGAAKLYHRGLFDYIELTPVPDTDIAPFASAGVPFLIHATTETHGVNIADPLKTGYNRDRVNDCIEWADRLDADVIVLHPGFGLLRDAVAFLQDIGDRRIAIENMPRVGLNGEPMVGYDADQVRSLMLDRFGFCLDLNHAARSSIGAGKSYKDVIARYLEISPKMFHISDGTLDSPVDAHLNIGQGDYDLQFFVDCICRAQSRYVTIETPRTTLTLEDSVKDLKRLKLIIDERSSDH